MEEGEGKRKEEEKNKHEFNANDAKSMPETHLRSGRAGGRRGL